MMIQELNWDSKFFGKRIGKLNLSKSKKYEFKELNRSFIDTNFELIYVFSESEIDGIESIDKKVIYINSKPTCESNDENIKEFCGNAETLYPLAYQAGHKSRFNIDNRISNYDFKRLYRLWVDNSINKSFADYIKVYVENDKPIGFITAKRQSDKITIGLIAVDASSRRKGIGKKLIQSIIRVAYQDNIPVEVATQAENIEACRFYEDLGFSIANITYIYHFWITQ